MSCPSIDGGGRPQAARPGDPSEATKAFAARIRRSESWRREAALDATTAAGMLGQARNPGLIKEEGVGYGSPLGPP